MKKRRYRKARKRFAYAALKATGIVVASFVAGLSMLGIERYSAIFLGKGSANAAETLPRLHADDDSLTVQRVHHFSMAVVGGRSTIPALAPYQLVEMELLAKSGEPRVVLYLQEKGRDQPVQAYERAVSEAYFSQVWQHLQDLEVAQLTDLSPYTEQVLTAKQSVRKLASAPSASATYRFQFKDGLYDYPNSFEVHGPEQLEDTRYMGVRDLTFAVLAEHFNHVLSDDVLSDDVLSQE